MMTDIAKLIEALTDLAIAATAYLNGGQIVEGEIRRERKPRAPKAPEAPAAAAAAAAPEEKKPADDGLGLDPEAPAASKAEPKAAAEKELTEDQSFAAMVAGVRAYIAIAKNDKPEDGIAQIKGVLSAAPFKVGKIQDLTHPQRIGLIAVIEKMAAGHK